MKKVLIAHQSTIPHYRVPFFNMLRELKPDAWDFEVAFDSRKKAQDYFFKERVDFQKFRFSILDVRTYSLQFGGTKVSYQTLLEAARGMDLVIVENALNNLAYPMSQLLQPFGVKVAHWGHGRDRDAVSPNLTKLISERIKMFLARRLDGFFAYTLGIKNYLIDQGLDKKRIFVTDNTIDINVHHRAYKTWLPKRQSIRKRLNLENKKTLLFVGRYTLNKRIEFLLEAFSILRQQDADIHLIWVGSGGESVTLDGLDGFCYKGPITDLDELAPIYVASDLFVIPGAVGLGPLQALCYNLPIMTIDAPNHGPEIEYLTTENSIVLKSDTTPLDYAMTIKELLFKEDELNDIADMSWGTISHLTIENMARKFIIGINTILEI